jgi:hypothetical protein
MAENYDALLARHDTFDGSDRDEMLTLIDDQHTALLVLRAERDAAFREMEARELHHFEVEEERDAALAAIQKARLMLKPTPNGDPLRERTLAVLTADPAPILAARDARIRLDAMRRAYAAGERQTQLASLVAGRPSDFEKGVMSCMAAIQAEGAQGNA